MTIKIKETLFICEEEDRKCELCGNIEECRPYGPNGEDVCFTCGMKDKVAAERQFAKRLGIANI